MFWSSLFNPPACQNQNIHLGWPTYSWNIEFDFHLLGWTRSGLDDMKRRKSRENEGFVEIRVISDDDDDCAGRLGVYPMTEMYNQSELRIDGDLLCKRIVRRN